MRSSIRRATKLLIAAFVASRRVAGRGRLICSCMLADRSCMLFVLGQWVPPGGFRWMQLWWCVALELAGGQDRRALLYRHLRRTMLERAREVGDREASCGHAGVLLEVAADEGLEPQEAVA